MIFFVKKVVSGFLFPLPVTLELLLVGLILLWFTRRQRAGKVLVTMGTVVLLGFSNALTSTALLRPLERHYPPVATAPTGALSAPAVGFIVVLGGSADHDPDVPITSHISPDQMARLIEGVRLHRAIPGSKLILSGDNDSAEGMTQVAESLGVSAQDILTLAQPRDTEEESRQIAPIVGSQRFILVTSAAHLPRAMGLFRKKGLQPMAAPTDYLTPRHKLEPDDYFPDGFKLYKAQVAIHEYLGLSWETLWRRL